MIEFEHLVPWPLVNFSPHSYYAVQEPDCILLLHGPSKHAQVAENYTQYARSPRHVSPPPYLFHLFLSLPLTRLPVSIRERAGPRRNTVPGCQCEAKSCINVASM